MKKKVVIIISILVFALLVCGCGKSDNAAPAASEPEPTPAPAASEPVNDEPEVIDTPQNEPSSGSTVNWTEFLKEYESWVDDYVAFMKKYKDNPTDPDLLQDYSAMVTKLSEWSEKADKIQNDLSPDDLSEYLKTLSRILDKINSV